MPSLKDARKSLRSTLSSKNPYEGATIVTQFEVTFEGDVPRLFAKAHVSRSPELEKRLTKRSAKQLDTLAMNAVEQSETDLNLMEVCDRSWICSKSRATFGSHYDARMNVNVEGSGIKISTQASSGPELDKFCHCPSHHVTGRSLCDAGYAVVTKQVPGDRSLTFFQSKCYRRMPTETASIEDAPPELPPTKRENIDRFLKTLDVEMANTVNTLSIADHFEWLKFLGHGSLSNNVYENAINAFTMEEPYRSMDHIILNPEDRIDAQIGDEWTSFDYGRDKYIPVEGSNSSECLLRKPAFC